MTAKIDAGRHKAIAFDGTTRFVEIAADFCTGANQNPKWDPIDLWSRVLLPNTPPLAAPNDEETRFSGIPSRDRAKIREQERRAAVRVFPLLSDLAEEVIERCGASPAADMLQQLYGGMRNFSSLHSLTRNVGATASQFDENRQAQLKIAAAFGQPASQEGASRHLDASEVAAISNAVDDLRRSVLRHAVDRGVGRFILSICDDVDFALSALRCRGGDALIGAAKSLYGSAVVRTPEVKNAQAIPEGIRKKVVALGGKFIDSAVSAAGKTTGALAIGLVASETLDFSNILDTRRPVVPSPPPQSWKLIETEEPAQIPMRGPVERNGEAPPAEDEQDSASTDPTS